MKNALILHGTGDSSKANWFTWLGTELTKLNWKTWIPDLPDADNPNEKKYTDFLLNKNWEFNEDSILVGHSSGAVEILCLLQALPENIQVNTCYLVGSFTQDILLDKKWEMLKDLFEKPFDFNQIKKRARKFVFIHSDDDPYCPLEQAQELARRTGGELFIREGQKHFSIGSAGERYKEFPFLLNLIKETSNENK